MSEKFNPSDPKYKSVEDLPKEEQGNFRNVEGGGFVKDSVNDLESLLSEQLVDALKEDCRTSFPSGEGFDGRKFGRLVEAMTVVDGAGKFPVHGDPFEYAEAARSAAHVYLKTLPQGASADRAHEILAAGRLDGTGDSVQLLRLLGLTGRKSRITNMNMVE